MAAFMRNVRHCILKEFKCCPFTHHPVCRKITMLKERSLVENIFPLQYISELQSVLSSKHQVAYCGYDPTADSLHIGNLLTVTALLHWQTLGHKALIVIGDQTAAIGDPTGRTMKRSQLDSKTIESNSQSIESSLRRIFKNFELHVANRFDAYTSDFKIFKNSQWYKCPALFLAEIGQHFRISLMLSRDSVKMRLKSEDGLTLAEFLYQVYQAYDWLHLYESCGCLFQFGGNDQMGNIYAGHDVISRLHGVNAFGITVPLIISSTGEKLGKSLSNNIWLNPDKTSPLDFYEHFMNISDDDVGHYLKRFTFLPLSTIESLMIEHEAHRHLKKAQEVLATNLTLLIHGKEELEASKNKYHSQRPEKKRTVC